MAPLGLTPIDGEPVRSCTVLAVQADGRQVTAVKELETDGKLHPTLGIAVAWQSQAIGT